MIKIFSGVSRGSLFLRITTSLIRNGPAEKEPDSKEPVDSSVDSSRRSRKHVKNMRGEKKVIYEHPTGKQAKIVQEKDSGKK
ncbi:MAG: hypothetical protein ACFFD4_02775 [Candidatus Odinarchaeota archaeon]